MGGIEQEESPEWTPACSICSIIAPMKTSLPSDTASTSTSIALSKKWSRSTGDLFETLTAASMYFLSSSSL